jgi:hypothetical protein
MLQNLLSRFTNKQLNNEMTWLTKAVLGEENFISATKRPTQPYRGRSIFLRGGEKH